MSEMDENDKILNMGDLKLSKIGTITVDGSVISCDDFEAEGASCREVAILALQWAQEQGMDIPNLQDEIDAQLNHPGGTGNVGVD